MKLSIVIPAYNVETQIAACVESCCQKEASLGSVYEIIIINDGSTDNTAGILQGLNRRFPELIIVSQENQGLSAARNAGLKISRGEYVWFVDGDDTIEPRSIEKILNHLSSEDAVQILGNNVCGETIIPEGCIGAKTARGVDLFFENKFSWGVPYTIYRNAFLKENNLTFYNGIFHEDMEFTPRAYFFARTVSSLPERVYNHLFNRKSITHVVNPKRSFDLLVVAKKNYLFFRRHKISAPTVADIISGRIVQSVVLMLDVVSDSTRASYCEYLSKHAFLLKIMLFASKTRYKVYGVGLLVLSRFPMLMKAAFRGFSNVRFFFKRKTRGTNSF